jgi:hypothetical protein
MKKKTKKRLKAAINIGIAIILVGGIVAPILLSLLAI